MIISNTAPQLVHITAQCWWRTRWFETCNTWQSCQLLQQQPNLLRYEHKQYPVRHIATSRDCCGYKRLSPPVSYVNL